MFLSHLKSFKTVYSEQMLAYLKIFNINHAIML